MSIVKNGRGVASVVSSVLLACGTSATAADAPTRDIEEIIVTAQKVAEDLSKVPISISVISAEQLANQQISDYRDLARSVPNFAFSSDGSPGGTTLQMRGISSVSGASTIGLYLDEVPITARSVGLSGQPELRFEDIQQVEVLRGPQGTLYGASSAGGVLRFRSNPVNLSEFEGSAGADAAVTDHGDPSYGIKGVLNAPIVDGRLGVRLSASYEKEGGYIDRVDPSTGRVIGKAVNDGEHRVARLRLLAEPFDGLSIEPAVQYQRTTYGNTDTITLGLHNATSTPVPESGIDTLIIPSLTVRYDFGSADLTSVTSDFTRARDFRVDGTYYNSAFIGDVLDSWEIPDLEGNLSGSVIGALPSPVAKHLFSRLFTQEIRLASKPYSGSGAPVAWVFGAYFSRLTDHLTDDESINNFTDMFTNLYGAGLLNAFFGGPLPGNMVYFNRKVFTEDQWSAFGDVSYYPAPNLRVSAGLRYLSATQDSRATAGGFFNGGHNTDSGNMHGTDHAVTPKLAVNYEFAPSNSVYAAISKGFRLGATNVPFPTTLCADKTPPPAGFKHDELWNYEVGAKLRPATGFAVSGSLFYIKWDQLQQLFIDPVCAFGYTDNVGSARSYGAEMDLTFKPTAELTLEAAGGYTNAKLTEDNVKFNLHSGDKIQGVPEWNGIVSADYERSLTAATTGFLRANYNYTGPSRGSLNASSPDYERPAYGLAGMSGGVRFDKLEISLYATNLLNNQKIIQTPEHALVPVGLTPKPRTIGISLTAGF